MSKSQKKVILTSISFIILKLLRFKYSDRSARPKSVELNIHLESSFDNKKYAVLIQLLQKLEAFVMANWTKALYFCVFYTL